MVLNTNAIVKLCPNVDDESYLPYIDLIGWQLLSVFLLSCVPLLALYLQYQRKLYQKWKMLDNFPGPPTIPVFGNALLLNRDNHELFDFVDEITRKYGNLSKLWLFHKPYVLISDADVAEKILTSKINLDKGDEMKVFHSWWGSGLLTAPASKWRQQRKLLNHTFSHSVLMEFLKIFNKESFALTNLLEKFAEAEEPFNIIPYTAACTLNIICETAMGKKLLNDGQANQEYIDTVTGMYHILLARITRPWLRPNIIWKLSPFGYREKRYLKILHGFTEKVIAEKRELRQKTINSKGSERSEFEKVGVKIEGQKVHMAFMDYLLDLVDEGHKLSDVDIRNEVDTFMAAGHDTTAYTVSWTLFLLATYPEHQVKVQAELDEIFDNNKDRSASSFDLSRMSYLGMCMKEALRMYPIVPFNFRKITEEVKCDDGRIIPSGINVVIMPYIIHKDPLHFPNPHEFQPERFLVKNCLKRHPFSYIPFSSGPRNCIGQKFGIYEAKVILSYLLRNYHWTALDKREDVKLDLDLVTRPMNGLRFRITKR